MFDVVIGGGSGIGSKVIENLITQKRSRIVNVDIKPSLHDEVMHNWCGDLRDPYFVEEIASGLNELPVLSSLLWSVRYRHKPHESDLEILKSALNVELYPLIKILELIDKKIQDDSTCICLVSSIASSFVSAQPFAYNIVKAAHIALIRTLAVKYGDKSDARFNVISPGIVNLEPYQASQSNHQHILQKSAIPRRDPVNGDDLARSIIFLLSNMSSAINGANIIADGGETLLDSYFVAQRTFKLMRD